MEKHKRHGDVILHPVKKIEGKEVKTNGKFVLAIGEATGHTHQILCEPKLMKITRNDRRNFVDVQEAELVHQQHKRLKLSGKYAQVQEREIDHFSGVVRNVVD